MITTRTTISVEFVDGHFQLPQPWKSHHQILPSWRVDMAVKSLVLTCRLMKNPKVHKKYVEQLQVVIDQGF